ncbi:MAG TPA: gliding motility-associated C-terminal domain-containing protein [Bacteroidia bacterium]|jgi:gliding motility-associated-like protein|nr:gliding motility-associated C-terminal domain-containing protein [Bacteroidia bacterium]
MKKSLFFTILLFNLFANAQPGKEAWHWKFGQAQLDFSSGAPVKVSPGPSFFSNACANISDENTGQNLFFTNGLSAFDMNNNIISNSYGMFGNNSTTQTLIVPWPGNPKLYFIISADKLAGNKGVHYSVVDLSLNNGLGKVTIKNQALTPAPATEKITAVRHCNGVDYWIITHSYNSNAFNAYLVNTSGINTTPVVSNTGTSHQFFAPGNDEATGYMKASPNGTKVAVGIFSDSLPLIEILDINNSTGIINNPVTINLKGDGGAYGISFSPDNSKLYASVYPGDSISAIYQYDLSSGIPATIIASQTVIKQISANTGYGPRTGVAYALQMGPDSKIYIARMSTDTLAVINNPNAAGTACNFQWYGVLLGPPGFQYAQYGLPNFIDANYAGIQINIPDIQQCNTFTATPIDAGSGFTNYFWSTGAGTQIITVSNPGKYWVTVTNTQGCTRTDTVNAYLLNPIKTDTLACDVYHANVTQGGVLAYNWFDANHNPVRNFTVSGNYYVDINYVSGCAIRDSINLTVVSSPHINLGNDTTFCKGNLLLSAFNPASTYTWSTGATSSSITATTAGTYWVHVKDANGCTDSDTLIIKPELTAFNFAMPNIVTPNNDNINDVIDFGKYQFSSLQIEIYNRWGQKVFESEGTDAIWKPSGDEGTYFYTAQYRIDCGTDSQTKNIKGYITVVR